MRLTTNTSREEAPEQGESVKEEAGAKGMTRQFAKHRKRFDASRHNDFKESAKSQ